MADDAGWSALAIAALGTMTAGLATLGHWLVSRRRRNGHSNGGTVEVAPSAEMQQWIARFETKIDMVVDLVSGKGSIGDRVAIVESKVGDIHESVEDVRAEQHTIKHQLANILGGQNALGNLIEQKRAGDA